MDGSKAHIKRADECQQVLVPKHEERI